MTEIKNFGIIGVADDVQLGKDGTRIQSTGTGIQVVEADGSTLTNIQTADAVNPTDVVTLQQLEANSSPATLVDVTGGQMELSKTPYAVELLTSTLKSDGIDALNHILGLLVPAAPNNFPGTYTLSVSSVGNAPLLASGSVPNNTSGGTLPATAGQSVTRVVGATSTNIIGATTGAASAFVGPGNSGTITALVNNASVGSHTLTGTSDNGTYGSLVISGDQAYPISQPGFYYSFEAQISSASMTQGWNRLQITDTAASNTNTVYVVDDNINTVPTMASGVVTQNTAGTLTQSSGINHYGTSGTLNLASVTMTNLAGETYFNGSPLTVSSTLTGPGTNAIFSAQTFTYANVGVTTPIARQTTSATALNTQSISINGNNTHTSGKLTYQGENVAGNSSIVTVSSPIILVKNGTAQTTQLDELNITSTHNSSAGTVASRVYLGSSATTDTPTLGSITAWSNSTDLSGVGYLQEAAVVGGTLTCNQTNYTTGFLPAGINYSGKNSVQYFTFVISQTALSNITVNITGTLTHMWVALPGVSNNSSISPNALGGAWWDAFQLYNGSGVPGRTGDTNAGCASGSALTSSGGSVVITFGTQSSTNSTSNDIVFRIKMAPGQSITAINLSY